MTFCAVLRITRRGLIVSSIAAFGCGARTPLAEMRTSDAGVGLPLDGGTDGASDRACGTRPHAPWPVAGHDLRGSHRSVLDGPRTNHVRWRYDFRTAYFAAYTPTIADDGTLYVVDPENDLLAVDETGHLRWRLEGDFQSSPSIGCDGTLYVGGAHRFSQDEHRWLEDLLLSVDTTSHIRWTYTRDTGALRISGPSPMPAPGGRVYVANDGIDAIAVDGSSVFHAQSSESASAFSTQVVVSSEGNVSTSFQWMTTPGVSARVVSFSSTGKLLWSIEGPAGAPLLREDGTVLIASERVVTAYSSTGNLVWNAAFPEKISSTLAEGPNGRLYLMTGDGVVAIEADHSTKLVYPWPTEITFSTIVVDASGWVYVAKRERLVVLRPDDTFAFALDLGPTVNGYAPIGSAGLAVGNGTLVIPTRTGLITLGP